MNRMVAQDAAGGTILRHAHERGCRGLFPGPGLRALH